MSTITDQLQLLEHAARTLENSGCRILEARASKRALPLILVAGATPCPAEHIRGEPLTERLGDVVHTIVDTHLGVCVTWSEVVP